MPQNKIKLPDVNTSTGTGAFVFATAPTIQTSLTGAYLTPSEILITDASKNIVSAPVLTYPSLLELAHLKGVTSPLQTQLGTKQVTIAGTLTDTYVATVVAGVATWAAPSGGGGGISGLTTNKITKATSATTIGDSGITDLGSGSALFGSNTLSATATPLNVSFGGTYGTNTVGTPGNLKWLMYSDGTPANSYGVGMSLNLMEIRTGTSGAIGFFVNNGIEAMRILSDQTVKVTGLLNPVNNVLVGTITDLSTATPAYLSLGGTYGSNVAGSSANLKLRVYDAGASSNYSGIGISSALLEISGGSTVAIGFFVNNGIEAMRILSTQAVRVGTTTYSTALRLNVMGFALFGDNTSLATATPVVVSFGGTYGNSAVGSSANLKWKLYSNTGGSTSVNDFGIGMSLNLMEFRCGTSGAIGFFPNNGVEAMRILSTGNLQFADAKDIAFNATTGTKIGTSTTQKLAFWNKTPIVQPTTGITGATRVAILGSALMDTDTFDGYTLQQVVRALVNTGILA